MFNQTIGCLNPNFSTRKSRLIPLLFLLFWVYFAHGQTVQALGRSPSSSQSTTQQQSARVQQHAQEISTLELGKPVERELAGGQKHVYQLALAAGQYAGIVVEQRGIDLTVRLQGNEGKIVASFDSEFSSQGEEKVELIAAAAGSYQLSVQASLQNALIGQYRIRVAEMRAATEQEHLLHEARRLEEAYRQAIATAKYEEARQFAERALAVGESVLGTEHPFVARLLFHLANYHLAKTNFAEAAPLFARALAVSEKSLGAEHPQTIDITRGLGELYRWANERDKAERLLERAGELSQKTLGAEHPLVAKCLRDLALLSNDPKRREELLQRALLIAERTLGPEHELIGNVLDGLGSVYINAKDYQRAEQVLLRARAIYLKTVGPESLNIGANLHILGYLAHRRRDHGKAEEYYLKSIARAEQALGPDNTRVASTLNNLADIYSNRGDREKSLAAYLRVLHIAETAYGPYHSLTRTALGNLAMEYVEQGNVTEAIKYQVRVDAVIERITELQLIIGSEREKLSYLESLTRRTDRTISLGVHIAPDDKTARALAALVLLQRKGRLLDAMSGSFAHLRQRAAAEERALLEQYNDTLAQLAHFALSGPQTMTVAEHRKKVGELETRKGRLEADISRRSAEFRAQSQPVTLAAVQAAIPAHAALVEFAVYRPFDPKAPDNEKTYGEPRYVAHVIRRQGEVQWKELGEAKEIDARVDALRQALRDPQRKDVQQLARAVDEKVMQPVRKLVGDATRLLLSPDGALNLIPFEALVDEQGRFLIERYAFTYLTSGRDILRMQVARDTESKPLVVANPSFGEAPIEQLASAPAKPAPGYRRRSVTTARNLSEIYFAPLGGTAQEARAIQSLYPEANLLTGAQATESAVKQIAAPRVLHIATHGFFLEDGGASTGDNPLVGVHGAGATAKSTPAFDRVTQGAHTKIENPLLRSGLALAGANQRGAGLGEDGILTALEASGLNLWGTKLVVLSACDTGLGEVRNGEGVYGLRRAFVLAGAESMIMSLWPVSDYSTRKLMTDYYRNLKQGMGRGASLRQVQLDMLRRNRQLHPFYWANFIQSGEWANLDGKR